MTSLLALALIKKNNENRQQLTQRDRVNYKSFTFLTNNTIQVDKKCKMKMHE